MPIYIEMILKEIVAMATFGGRDWVREWDTW